MVPDGRPDRFLSWRQVADLTGLGRTTAWRLRRAGDFPDAVTLSPGRVAWRERDIAAWAEGREGAAAHPSRKTGRPARRPPEPATLPLATDLLPDPGPRRPEPERPARASGKTARVPSPSNQLGFDF